MFFQTERLAIHYTGKLYLRAENTLTRRILMLIKNGFIINPASGESYEADIRIKGGVIEDISENISSADGENVVDARGLTIAPGLIDTHVHFRDPGFTYKETLHTGALAAAKGGFTSVI